MEYWNTENVTRWKIFIEKEWQPDYFNTKEILSCIYRRHDNGVNEYIPEVLIEKVLVA